MSNVGGRESPVDSHSFKDAFGTDSHGDTEGISVNDGLYSTSTDKADMKRLGRTQELRRSFRELSMLAFAMIVQASWEFVLCSMTAGLTGGGRAGLTWSFIWTFAGFLPIVLSLAEMASMAPTSGGQYHWVSEFAPKRYQRPLSYFAGWQSTLAWQAGNASGPFVTGSLMQVLISISIPSYEGTNWQASLLVIANVVLLYFVNVYGARALPYVQTGFAAFHLICFVAVIAVLWARAPLASASDVFTGFVSTSGWPNLTLSLFVGQISAIWALIGSDCAAHMAEETQDASISVPRAMLWGYVSNGIMGIITVVTICFALPDLDSALADETGYPFIYAFMSAMNTAGTVVLSSGLLLLIFASNVSYLAGASRETFAFARDNGLPFGGWISAVHPRHHIPVNAHILTSGIAVLLSLINIGSSAAFNAIISLNTVAIMLSYALSISCVLHRRITRPVSLPPSRFRLGRAGVPINIAAVLYAVWAFFWAMWPSSYPVTLDTFNWAPVIFGIVTLLSMVMWALQGRRIYKGPAALIKETFRDKSVE